MPRPKKPRYKRVADHNGAQWLDVRYRETSTGPWGGGNRSGAGWFVVRTCACHAGEPVTLALADKAAAERAQQAMLAASRMLGT